MGSQEYDDSLELKEEAIGYLKQAQSRLGSIISRQDAFFNEFGEEFQFDIVASTQDIQEIIKRLS